MGEYVSGVLIGDAGIMHLQKVCNELNKRCEIDRKCSVHVHIGGGAFNKDFIVFAYILGLLCEKQILAMMPHSRRLSTYCRYLECVFSVSEFLSKLDSSPEDYKIIIDEAFTKIFQYVGHIDGIVPNKEFNKKSRHPMGEKCGYHHETQRYCWLNFVPALFKTRGNVRIERIDGIFTEVAEQDKTFTLEFRPMSATLNFAKIKNWIKICMAFMYFVDNHQKDIIKGSIVINGKHRPIDLQSVILKAYPKSGKELWEYIIMRTDMFSQKDLGKIAEDNEYLTEEKISEFKVKDLI